MWSCRDGHQMASGLPLWGRCQTGRGEFSSSQWREEARRRCPLKGDDNQGAPTWSPDGKSLVYGNVLCQEERTCAIHKIDLASGEVSTLPGSLGLGTARWSRDGRHIAALNPAQHELMVFDLNSQRWRKLAGGINGNHVSWSSDSRYVYTKSSMSGSTKILRVPVGGGCR